jgi:hypothetical protein
VFGHRYFGARWYGQRYFGESAGVAPIFILSARSVAPAAEDRTVIAVDDGRAIEVRN